MTNASQLGAYHCQTLQNTLMLKIIEQKKIKDEPKIKELRSAGVYLIYEDNKIIYVGSAGKKHTLRNRIGDLFTYRPNSVQSKGTNHNLTYKLMCKEKYKRFDGIKGVRKFYFRCRFKFIQTRKRL